MPDPDSSLTNELARERNREAADRPPIARHMGLALVAVGLSALAVIFVF